ncbi:MAG: hypothetical protein CMJ67_05390 [Planctomycetaceae bacterium]|nr:hypothetical protein [Planctomycetaceae bacterium]
MNSHLAIVSLALSVSAASVATAQSTITVCASGCQYIDPRDAIDAAEDGDLILISAGTYVSDDIKTQGKAITIRGETDKNGAPTTVFDGMENTRVMSITDGETSTTILENLVITNGSISMGSGGAAGLSIDGASPKLINCTFQSNLNQGPGGGGMNISGGNPTLIECTFTGNDAYNGGGLYIENASPTLIDCTFINNTCGFRGGGVYNATSSPNLEGCSFVSNTAGDGGAGMTNWFSSPTLTDCTFSLNSASQSGGGIYNNGPCIVGGSGIYFCGNSPSNVHYDKGSSVAVTCDSALPDCSDCADADGDGIPDFRDICPLGDDEIDSDGDGTPDACDECPDDVNKIAPGTCGCGVVDTNIAGDYDCDGDLDLDDYLAIRIELGICAADIDGDGIVNGADLAYILGYWGICTTP